jgi:hypothetical protein
VYCSGTEVFGANTWSVSIPKDSAEYIKFGDSWVNVLPGVNRWSGSIGATHDQATKLLQDAATASIVVSLLLYPQRSDLTTYYSGNAIFSFDSHDVSVDAVESLTASFVGDGTLTLTGFS